ncbi:porin family protein [Terriglobus tenax]|uniref:porin family protein n=1 Tax=Terriglobus tenax TaxID=1111115 RepID=UPI0021E0E469|nr:porin family protein [Terriglobus tenax]
MKLYLRSIALPGILGALSLSALAQSAPRLDLGVTYLAQRSIKANTTQSFWMQGGSIELGANLYKGFGIAADVSGGHTNSIGSSGVPLALVTATFGPRYRWHSNRKLSLYGQALIGQAYGFNSLFPNTFGAKSDENSFALQLNGGVDYALTRHTSLRLLDAGWLRTQLPNSTNNVQNTLRLGAGVVVRFGR